MLSKCTLPYLSRLLTGPRLSFSIVGKRSISYSSKQYQNIQSFTKPKVISGFLSHTSHPLLMKPNEVTLGISRSEYELRRFKLMKELDDGDLIICLGYDLRYASKDIFYPFHQNTNFFYLSGFNEPSSAMVLEKNSKLERQYTMTMFVRSRTGNSDLWEGPKAGFAGAVQHFGADEALESTQLIPFLSNKCSQKSRVLYLDWPIPNHTFQHQNMQTWIKETLASSSNAQDSWMPTWLEKLKDHENPLSQNSGTPTKVKIVTRGLCDLLEPHRLIKSSAEVELLQKAANIAADGFKESMKKSYPGMYEYEILAELEYQIKKRGAQQLSFVPVVAGGSNALILHYTDNNQVINQGEMVMVDAGAHYHGYVSDISRTWPIDGKFSKEHSELYLTVLKVQEDCIKMCTEEQHISLDTIYKRSVSLMQAGLANLGIQVDLNLIYSNIYPHHVGHYLGLDVHDTETISRMKRLKAGMVVTIEPGLYIPYDNRFPKKYQGIGIRIEDDVVVGEKYYTVLTRQVPKKMEEIEAIMVKEGNKIT